jgi:type IV pilus assembly protein PilW
MLLNSKKLSLVQAGFTLVEIMVGLAIGMLATLVIVQVMSVFEGQRRATSGTADAQTNGSIALYNIGRELQFAGYPLMPAGLPAVADSPLECTMLNAAADTTNITPAIITDGVAVAGVTSASDSITLRRGDSLAGGIPTEISGVVGSVLTLGTLLSPGSNLGCTVNDVSLVVNGANCFMSTVTALSTAVVPPVPSSVTLQNAANAIAGAGISCLGTWHAITYQVNNGNLERQDIAVPPVDSLIPTPAFNPSVAGIVNMQAQYGVSASANSNQIIQWVEPTGIWAAAALSLTPATRNRIKAIRIAVVARNAKMEPAAVTAACSSTTAAAPTGLCAWAGVAVGGAITIVSPAPTIDLSDADANWARYHYRVYETVIPLRNMIWSKDTL